MGAKFLFWLFAILLIASKGFAQQQQEEPKNVHYLMHMSIPEIRRTMSFVASSLGVNCHFCHVETEKGMDWASDDKEEKRKGRQMIQMVMDINKNSFENRVEVSCFTCHQGHPKPISVPSLPQPPAPEASKETEEKKPELPPAHQLAIKYFRAIGLKDEQTAPWRTRILKGTTTGFDGKPMTLEIYQQAPDKFLIVSQTEDGMIQQGFDGKAGWMKTEKDQRLMKPDEIQRARETLAPFDVNQIGTPGPSITVRDKDKVDNHDVYVVRAPVDDKTNLRLLIDAQSGLVIRKTILRQTPIAIIPQEFDFDDYREVDGLKVPFAIRSVSVNARSLADYKINEMRLNAPIEESKFSPPAAKAQ
jgi:photosynthetic reaction center cytochrome c subunit